jgi:hypothetical protein
MWGAKDEHGDLRDTESQGRSLTPGHFPANCPRGSGRMLVLR